MQEQKLGIWIKNIAKCENGNSSLIIQKCLDHHIGWIAVKSGDAYRLNQWYMPLSSKFIDQCHEAGLKIYTWNFSRPSTWAAEIQQILSCQKEGSDGHILLTEDEWRGYSVEVERFLSTLRKKTGPDPFLGFTGPSIYNFNGNFPYISFFKHCDAFLPFCLDSEKRKSYAHVSTVLQESFNDLLRLTKTNKLEGKLICPVGQVHVDQSDPDDLITFLSDYKESYPSIYCWDDATEGIFNRLESLPKESDIDSMLEETIVTESSRPESITEI